MLRFGLIKRRDLIRYLRELGFEGSYVGGKHQYMAEGRLNWRFPILISVISVETFSPGFCGRPGLMEMNGKGFE